LIYANGKPAEIFRFKNIRVNSHPFVVLSFHERHHSRAHAALSHRHFDRARNSVLLIEQRLLPHEFKIVATKNFRETAAAIRDMIVRGAGAIGATAAYGLAQGALAFRGNDLKKFSAHIETVYQTLKSARPTAVDPVNAMNDVRHEMARGKTVAEKQSLALAAAEEFANEDVRHCEEIGRHGAKLIRNGMKILTHCNAGWLAFVDIGTATAPMYAAQKPGKNFMSSATKPARVRKAQR
jgi:methylthioribose-1-phosphate isomerase